MPCRVGALVLAPDQEGDQRRPSLADHMRCSRSQQAARPGAAFPGIGATIPENPAPWRSARILDWAYRPSNQDDDRPLAESCSRHA